MPKKLRKTFVNPSYNNPVFRGNRWVIGFDMDSVLNEGYVTT